MRLKPCQLTSLYYQQKAKKAQNFNYKQLYHIDNKNNKKKTTIEHILPS